MSGIFNSGIFNTGIFNTGVVASVDGSEIRRRLLAQRRQIELQAANEAIVVRFLQENAPLFHDMLR